MTEDFARREPLETLCQGRRYRLLWCLRGGACFEVLFSSHHPLCVFRVLSATNTSESLAFDASQRRSSVHQSKRLQHSTTMTSSKFVEILDVCDTPFSNDNVSLDDVLAETRRRSTSASSASSASSSSSEKSSSRDRSPTSSVTVPVKPRLRALSIKRPKT